MCLTSVESGTVYRIKDKMLGGRRYQSHRSTLNINTLETKNQQAEQGVQAVHHAMVAIGSLTKPAYVNPMC